jgi:hypothetical protein
MTVRRSIALVLTTTALALGGSVLTATAAEARNVGGTFPVGAICFSPGQTQARSEQADGVLSCFCYVAPPVGERNVGGTVPEGDTTCPPGILTQASRPDRNVGG